MKQPQFKLIMILILIITGIAVFLLNTAFLQEIIEPEDVLADIIIHPGTSTDSHIATTERIFFPTITRFPEVASTATPAPALFGFSPTKEELPVITLTATTQPISGNLYDESKNPFIIGYSVEGRPLEMFKFGNGESVRLIIAGIHGGYEYNTTDLAYALIQEITAVPELIPENVTLYILPSLNPDGLAHSHGYAGRANANNVDLNRNWELYWSQTWNPDGCWQYLPISGGTSPLSEPEVASLDQFITHKKPTAVISYHSAALGIFSGGSPDLTISDSLAESIAAVAPYPYPPIQTNCEMTGQFIDSLAYRSIPAVDIELSNHKDIELEDNFNILRAFLNWNP